jgi:hypothetical protein
MGPAILAVSRLSMIDMLRVFEHLGSSLVVDALLSVVELGMGA